MQSVEIRLTDEEYMVLEAEGHRAGRNVPVGVVIETLASRAACEELGLDYVLRRYDEMAAGDES